MSCTPYRTQDVALQKARDNVSQRNRLRLWLAPLRIDGLDVWVGQVSRDIGIKLTTQSCYLTTQVISPDVDQDRFYLMQDLILSGAVSRPGSVQGVGTSSMPNPRINLTGEPYLTDGLGLVRSLGGPLNKSIPKLGARFPPTTLWYALQRRHTN